MRRATGLPIQCADPQATCAPLIDELATVLDGVATDRTCRRAFYSHAKRYHRRRSHEIRKGQRRARKAERFVARISDKCEGELVAPAGECAGLSDPGEAALCVRAVVESITQSGIGISVPPNFVLVLSDDQRWDTLWAMPRVRESIVDRGLDFRNSFKSTSLCCPDRASIFTGLYAHNHGVTSNQGAHAFDHHGDTIQKRLRDLAGYRTALVGKYMVGTDVVLGGSPAPGWDEWHVFPGSGGFGSTHGLYYNYLLSTNGNVRRYAPLDGFGVPTRRHEYSTDLLRDRALDLIGRWSEEPFFVEYAPFAPHTTAIAADRHVGIFASLPPVRPPNHMPFDLSGKPQWVRDWRVLQVLSGEQPALADRTRIEMLETLPALDEAVGALSDRLEAEGLTDNTVLIYTSDNGYLYLEHWLTLKNYPYEESIRVPLAIRYPKMVPAGREVAEMVQSIDFYPTFAELAGIVGAPVDGASLVPLFEGAPSVWRQEILIEHFSPAAAVDTSSGIRTQDWKLIRTDAAVGVTLELYDMQLDPFEMNNVADEPANAGLIATLSAKLDLLEQQ